MSDRNEARSRGTFGGGAGNGMGAVAVEAIARRVVELLERRERLAMEPRYVDAATLAHDLSVERDWVYAHAPELGAIRLGGPRGRLRFDRYLVAERLSDSEAQGSARRANGGPPQSPGARGRVQRGGVKSGKRRQRAGVLPPTRSPKRTSPGR